MSNIMEKLWGDTECLEFNSETEIHRIHGKPGYHCSKHIHKLKHNMFYVISGEMYVEIFRGSHTDTHFLQAGEYITVPPGEKHRMGFTAETEALEIYWPLKGAKVLVDDIFRDDLGGKVGE